MYLVIRSKKTAFSGKKITASMIGYEVLRCGNDVELTYMKDL